MTPDELIACIELCIATYRAQQVPEPEPEPPPPFRVVTPEMNLQAELNAGGAIHLVAGGQYAGVELPSDTVLIGNGASIVGSGIPALRVRPAVNQILVEDLTVRSNVQGPVVLLGDNDPTTQNHSSQVPFGITLRRVIVPSHRGKRGFEINASDVVLEDCEARDVYEASGSMDSAAIGVLNTPGQIAVRGGVFEGGSHPVLMGGDEMKLTDSPVIQDVTFDGCLFTRPPTWQNDGINHRVKNLFEIKNGRRVSVRHCIMEHCWTQAQTGVAIVLTPTRMGVVQDVLFEDCAIRNCAAGVQLTGSDINKPYTPDMWTGGIVLRRCAFTISKAQYTGTGRFITTERGVTTIDVEDCTVAMDGTSVIYVSGTPLMARLRVVDSAFNCGQYGINIAGGANLSNWAAGVSELTVTGNTMAGAATALKTNLAAIGKTPTNLYV